MGAPRGTWTIGAIGRCCGIGFAACHRVHLDRTRKEQQLTGIRTQAYPPTGTPAHRPTRQRAPVCQPIRPCRPPLVHQPDSPACGARAHMCPPSPQRSVRAHRVRRPPASRVPTSCHAHTRSAALSARAARAPAHATHTCAAQVLGERHRGGLCEQLVGAAHPGRLGNRSRPFLRRDAALRHGLLRGELLRQPCALQRPDAVPLLRLPPRPHRRRLCGCSEDTGPMHPSMRCLSTGHGQAQASSREVAAMSRLAAPPGSKRHRVRRLAAVPAVRSLTGDTLSPGCPGANPILRPRPGSADFSPSRRSEFDSMLGDPGVLPTNFG